VSYSPGPFNGPHLYLQWGGALPGGEIWSNGLRLAPAPNAAAPVFDQAILNGAVAAISAYHARQTTWASPRAILQYVKLNAITVAGKYADNVTHEAVVANIPGGGNVDNTPANQVSLCVSLTTAVSRGPAHRGRFYTPLPCVLPAADGLLGIGDALNAKNSAQTLITALNAITPNVQVAVMSRKAGAPGSRFVTGVQVGRVLDTQRRRRNKLAEAYQ
jgi:hypothetical protein